MSNKQENPMQVKLGVMLLCVSLVCVAQARATVLPDSCGDDKVKFDVATKKNQPAPAGPAGGKAQIVLIETLDGCVTCGTATTRFGMDGAWVGANKGSSYFTLDAAPGEHHLCTDWQSEFDFLKQKVGLISFTAEAGKVYYFEAKVTIDPHQNETGPGSNSETDRNLAFAQLSDDDGKYRVKVWKLSKSKSQ
jgi:hypothetical protein